MILGTFMGGMHAWLWSILYPTFMDGIMPIVCLPVKITGRNLLWRRIIIEAIKYDPDWEGGKYAKQPYSLKATWPVARMLLDGLPHLADSIKDLDAAETFIHKASAEATKKDANDLIYVLQASQDYDPEPKLASIQTKVFALDFTDDQLDPAQFHVLEELTSRLKHGKATIQAGTPSSSGHLTMKYPAYWAKHVAGFWLFLNEA